jgi:hypothetical protein
MSDVHIEGMGVMGSLVAWKLHQAGIDFTWHDTNRLLYKAWTASTGLIYPSGHGAEKAGYYDWVRLHEAPPWPNMPPITERGAHWFVTKSVPHGAHNEVQAERGRLRRGIEDTVHVNPQRLVTATREAFRAQETATYGARLKIVAHGYSARLDHVVWGWSAGVQLYIAPSILSLSHPLRPSFYLRRDRFTLRYALPRPGTILHYAGSLTVVQRTPKLLDATKHLRTYMAFLEQETDGQVRVERVYDGPTQGWRPAPSKAELEEHGGQPLPATADGNLLTLPPLALSGVRYSPMLADFARRWVEAKQG